MSLIQGEAIVNIVKVEVITEETTPKTYEFDSASEATYSPRVSQGTENVLRYKNTIKAIDKTEDIQYGTDLVLKDNVFLGEVFALIDGGTLEVTDGEVTGYEPPVAGQAVQRTPFTLNVYQERKEYDEVVGYVKFSFFNCKGSPAKYNLQDGQFFVPEYTITSLCKKGAAPYRLDFPKTLV